MAISLYTYHFKKSVIQSFSTPLTSKLEAEDKVNTLFNDYLESLKGLDNERELILDATEFKNEVFSNLDSILETLKRRTES